MKWHPRTQTGLRLTLVSREGGEEEGEEGVVLLMNTISAGFTTIWVPLMLINYWARLRSVCDAGQSPRGGEEYCH